MSKRGFEEINRTNKIYEALIKDETPSIQCHPLEMAYMMRDTHILVEKEVLNKLIEEFLDDLVHHYDYDYGEADKMEKLIQKWEKRKNGFYKM
jgi:hypothetical protein